jgi:hypothetical protein
MGTAECWEKLERGKSTNLNKNHMEEFVEGPVFHIGTNGESELYCRMNAVGRLCARMHACRHASSLYVCLIT